MTKPGCIFLLIGLLFLGACSGSQTTPADQTTPDVITNPPTAPTTEVPSPLSDIPGISPEQVRNAEYQLGLMDQIRLVQLTDGPADDFDPCFLPNGRIVFVTERRGGYLRCGRHCRRRHRLLPRRHGESPRSR